MIHEPETLGARADGGLQAQRRIDPPRHSQQVVGLQGSAERPGQQVHRQQLAGKGFRGGTLFSRRRGPE